MLAGVADPLEPSAILQAQTDVGGAVVDDVQGVFTLADDGGTEGAAQGHERTLGVVVAGGVGTGISTLRTEGVDFDADGDAVVQLGRTNEVDVDVVLDIEAGAAVSGGRDGAAATIGAGRAGRGREHGAILVAGNTGPLLGVTADGELNGLGGLGHGAQGQQSGAGEKNLLHN